jgi:aromatic ring hydroxylase
MIERTNLGGCLPMKPDFILRNLINIAKTCGYVGYRRVDGSIGDVVAMMT